MDVSISRVLRLRRTLRCGCGQPRSALAGIEALQRPAKLTLRTDSKYLPGGITKWIEGWQLSGWKSAARKPVKDDGLWRGLADAISLHDVTVG
jgi:ribonuclease HI